MGAASLPIIGYGALDHLLRLPSAAALNQAMRTLTPSQDKKFNGEHKCLISILI
jgi:hypothetical protein